MRVEAGLHRLQREQRLDQHAGAGQQHERRGDLRDGEDAQAAAGAAGNAQAAVREADSIRAAGRRQARNKRQEHRGENGQNRADPEHAGINGEIERANRKARGVARQDGNHRTRAQHAEQRASAAEQETFGEKRAAQRTGACAERGAHGEFVFAANGARQNQVGDVRAGDDEDEPGRRQQHQQHGSRPEVIWSRRSTASMRESAFGE